MQVLQVFLDHFSTFISLKLNVIPVDPLLIHSIWRPMHVKEPFYTETDCYRNV